MKCPFELPVRKEVTHVTEAGVKYKVLAEKYVFAAFLSKNEADYIVHVINSHEKLVSELRASDNWLHRLLKSCVILLDDGEVTKRAVEKQSRYNQQALEAENSNERH